MQGGIVVSRKRDFLRWAELVCAHELVRREEGKYFLQTTYISNDRFYRLQFFPVVEVAQALQLPTYFEIVSRMFAELHSFEFIVRIWKMRLLWSYINIMSTDQLRVMCSKKSNDERSKYRIVIECLWILVR